MRLETENEKAEIETDIWTKRETEKARKQRSKTQIQAACFIDAIIHYSS